MKEKWLLFFMILTLGGCAYIDQNLKVVPQTNIIASSEGAGKRVSLVVLDERSEQAIGKRGNGYGMGSAKITTEQDLMQILKDAVSDGLRKKGFEPVGKDESPTSMRVELRVLAYDIAIGLWTGGNIGKSTIKVIATSANNKSYERSYHGNKEIRTCFVGSQETNTNVVNGAFNEAINNIFNDKELIAFIAAP